YGQDLDPVEDFLVYTRTGHCNRFATALTLMLRARGVPARIALGFRGYESTGDGAYQVRQSHAHSWVEVLVQRTTEDNHATRHWLIMDPTPAIGDGADGEGKLARIADEFQRAVTQFFKNFIIEYNTDKQARARAALSNLDVLAWPGAIVTILAPLAAQPIVWAVLGLVTGGLLWRRRVRIYR